MMKKYWLLFAFAIVSLVSCVKETDRVIDDNVDPFLRLEFQCAQPGTKAGINGTEDGIVDWNENLIKTLDVFMYKDGSTTENAVIKKHYAFTPNEQDLVQLDINLTRAQVDALVPSSNYFQVYVVANWATNLTAESNTSLSHLKELEVSTNFVAATDHIQDSFIMTGEATIGPVKKKKSLIAPLTTIPMRRLAAKLDVRIFVEDRVILKDKVIVGGEEQEIAKIWIPLLNQMQVYLENGVQSGALSGVQPDTPTYFSYRANPVYYAMKDPNDESKFVPLAYEQEERTETVTKYGNDGLPIYENGELQTETVTRKYWLTDPMYVYPQHWVYGENRPTTGNVEPTLKLLLPWSLLDDQGHPTNEKMFYYKVIIPEDIRDPETIDGQTVTYKKNFVRNNIYRLRIRVAILGSETDEASVSVTGTYAVANWQDRDIVIRHADIGNARYLSIPRSEYTMYNTTELSIPFTTSHPVRFKTASIRVTKPYYGTANNNATVGGGTVKTAGSGDPYPSGSKYIEYSEAQRKAISNAVTGESKDWFKLEGNKIVIDHKLDNTIGHTYFDYSPYRFQITIEQGSNTSYYASVVVIQHPALTIVSQRNSDETATNYYNRTTYEGYTFLNGQAQWPYNGNLSRGNTNFNMYIISTSVLPSDSDMIIGDPRSTTVDNVIASSALGKPTEGGDNRRMSNYYPASSDTQQNMTIAPSFRIASSFGASPTMSRNDAIQRCAGYQEDGYPAGRWRLPTVAEIQYMALLTTYGLIPRLLGDNTNNSQTHYWSNVGYVTVYGGNSNTTPVPNTGTDGSRNVRCVYDEWYWSNTAHPTVPKETFYWGDEPR